MQEDFDVFILGYDAWSCSSFSLTSLITFSFHFVIQFSLYFHPVFPFNSLNLHYLLRFCQTKLVNIIACLLFNVFFYVMDVSKAYALGSIQSMGCAGQSLMSTKGIG